MGVFLVDDLLLELRLVLVNLFLVLVYLQILVALVGVFLVVDLFLLLCDLFLELVDLSLVVVDLALVLVNPFLLVDPFLGLFLVHVDHYPVLVEHLVAFYAVNLHVIIKMGSIWPLQCSAFCVPY